MALELHSFQREERFRTVTGDRLRDLLLALAFGGLLRAHAPAGAFVPNPEQTTSNTSAPCLEPLPLVGWADYQGPYLFSEDPRYYRLVQGSTRTGFFIRQSTRSWRIPIAGNRQRRGSQQCLPSRQRKRVHSRDAANRVFRDGRHGVRRTSGVLARDCPQAICPSATRARTRAEPHP